MPFGVKMEAMETEETWKKLVKYVENNMEIVAHVEADKEMGFFSLHWF